MNEIQAPCLSPVTLTGVVRKLRQPAGFLRRTIYSGGINLSTEDMELGREDDGRETLPFVLPGASALVVGRRERSMERITTPNIRVKTSLNPGDVFEARELGENPFNPQMNGRLQLHVTRIQSQQERDFQNTEEWMCKGGLEGALAYTLVGGDSWQIDYGRPAGHTIILGGASTWDQATAFPELDARFARKIVQDEEGLPITDCLLGEEAAEAFIRNDSVRQRLDGLNYEIGALDITTPYIEDGSVNFLGRFAGVRFWEYCRSLRVSGVDVQMIRPKYAEFFSRGDNGANFYYGAVKDDFDFIRGSGAGHGSIVSRGGAMIGPRFAKSWQTPDPTSIWILLQGRPMPFNRRPGWNVSMQVVA